MKTLIFTLLVLGGISSYILVAAEQGFYLTPKFALGINEKLYHRDNQEYLLFSGWVGHSSLAVKKIYTKEDGDTLIVYIELIPVSTLYKDGNFSIELKLSPKIQKVALASSKDIIWERK